MMVINAPLDREKLKNLLAEISENIESLGEMADFSLDEFKQSRNNYAIAEHHFRRALEGIISVGTHLLSRLPAKTKDYQEVILALGKHGIVPNEFAEKNRKLAGYRNRLVHMYWEVETEELHQVIKQHLEDLSDFKNYFVEYIRKQGE